MKQLLNTILPENDNFRKWFAVIFSVIIAGIFTIWGIYGIGKYGIALFILTPILLGAIPSILYGFKKQISKMEAFRLGVLTLALYLIALFTFAIEGAICIVMAIPIGVFFMWLGSWIGYLVITKSKSSAPNIMILIIFSIPSMSFIEREVKPSVSMVQTSIEINADPETVWKNVIEFPQLKEPKEFIFKTGIAYPINAKINGKGVGAIRHCNFTTGSFVEPITVWNEPNLLKFDVVKQPEPMKEVSFWDLNAPHLHDYFVSEKGQFKLIKINNGKTLLEGTTWYHHDIYPEFYWRIWSDLIIHKIHERVLNHIKITSEKK